MEGDELEDTVQLYRKTLRCFACTNIVESGVDIPNTIIINNAPPVFGLSDLHQLRGRAAATKSILLFAAYADEHLYRPIPGNVWPRWKQHSDLGSGFQDCDEDLISVVPVIYSANKAVLLPRLVWNVPEDFDEAINMNRTSRGGGEWTGMDVMEWNGMDKRSGFEPKCWRTKTWNVFCKQPRDSPYFTSDIFNKMIEFSQISAQPPANWCNKLFYWWWKPMKDKEQPVWDFFTTTQLAIFSGYDIIPILLYEYLKPYGRLSLPVMVAALVSFVDILTCFSWCGA